MQFHSTSGKQAAFPFFHKPILEVTMKRLSLLVAFPVLIGILCVQSLIAEDLGWLQPGVRVWYVGGVSDTTFSPSAQEADLISKFLNGSAYVRQPQALVNWTSPLPSTEWINPSPYSEAIFWIHPQRLKAMKTGDVVPWEAPRPCCPWPKSMTRSPIIQLTRKTTGPTQALPGDSPAAARNF